jgi:DNA-binding transcriptional MerR regulator
MANDAERRYSISEVSENTGVPDYTLRQWEKLFPMLRPHRNKANQRYYREEDLRIALRIKELLWVQHMKPDGARVRLAQELHGIGRPRTRREVIDILDRMENEIRGMLDLLDEELPDGEPR